MTPATERSASSGVKVDRDQLVAAVCREAADGDPETAQRAIGLALLTVHQARFHRLLGSKLPLVKGRILRQILGQSREFDFEWPEPEAFGHTLDVFRLEDPSRRFGTPKRQPSPAHELLIQFLRSQPKGLMPGEIIEYHRDERYEQFSFRINRVN